MKKLVIFDLDGTLLNTIADLAACTNHALSMLGYPTHEEGAYRFFVGNGINKLFERALPEAECTEANVQRVREIFIPYYDAHKTDLSMPYAGVTELLAELSARGYHLAVASNKYHAATVMLVEKFFDGVQFSVVLGQREGIPTKPHPHIVQEIMTATGVDAAQTVYVGDSGVDMETGRRAGVCTVGVSWGFRTVEELSAFSPALIANTPQEILAFVEEKFK